MENVLFKQSFRGFDRQQVLKYIDELSRQMNTQREEYTQQQQNLEEEINTLSNKLSEGGERLKLSLENSAKLTEELDSLKQNNAELKRQIALYRTMIGERDKEISQIKSDYNRLAEHKEQLEAENRQWKSKQDEIAACMVEASVRARQIIDEATAEARRRKREFEHNAGNLMDKVVDMKGQIAALEEQLNQSFAKLSTAMQNMDKASSLIESQVKEYQQKVDKTDVFTGTIQPEPKQEKPRAVKVTPQPVKKSLTDSVLDTISKLLEK